jgi:lantibiotic modifying enzyme
MIREKTANRATFRDAAARIGESICASAIWSAAADECNWMGTALPRPEDDAPGGLVSAALWPTMYGGSAGIALFLAELHRIAPHEQLARTALGALRRSARVVGTTSKNDSPLSFFTGELGIAYALRRATVAGIADGLNAEFAALVMRVGDAFAAKHSLDLMGGNAGALPALLRMRALPGCERFVELARSCADELVEAAQWEGDVASWDPQRASGPEMGAPAPLTGFSHGASGMALALLEAYAFFGDERYARTAHGAFAYEDGLFVHDLGNWIDVSRPFTRDADGVRGSCETAWCHGGPGIALARLRARELDPAAAQAHEARARTALDTTVRALRANVENAAYDTSLCHGMTGLAQIVAIAGDALDDDEYRGAADDVTLTLVERYGASGRWPLSAWHATSQPCLMTGLAGIGHHLLRLAEPSVPPVLVLDTPMS